MLILAWIVLVVIVGFLLWGLVINIINDPAFFVMLLIVFGGPVLFAWAVVTVAGSLR